MTEVARTFSYEEAVETFPRVQRITEKAVRQVEALYSQVRSIEEGDERRDQLDAAFREIVRAWADRVQEVGCEVKGLWLVDWDCGAGYYCWKYPEPGISHFHGYEEGFAGRVPIQ